MRRHTRNILVATLTLGALGAAGASIALAAFAPRQAVEAGATAVLDDAVAHDKGDTSPVVGGNLFAADFGVPVACMSKDAVVQGLAADEAKFGGKTYVLGDGLQQAFADAWRHESEVAPVPVTSIVAHLFADQSGSEWTADIVEIGSDGCAMSRTLIPGGMWSSLLQSALGPEV